MKDYKKIFTSTFQLTDEETRDVAEIVRNLHSSADCVDSLPDAMSKYFDNDRELAVNVYNEIVRSVRDFQTSYQKEVSNQESAAARIDELLAGKGQLEQFKILLSAASVLTGSLYSKGDEEDAVALSDWNVSIAEYTQKANDLEENAYLPSLADGDIRTLKEKVCELFELNAEVLLSDPNVVKGLKTGFGTAQSSQAESNEETRIFQAAALYIACTKGKLPSLGKDQHETVYTPYYFGIAASAGSEAADAYIQHANGKIEESMLLGILKAISTTALTLLLFVFGMALGLVVAAVIYDVITAILGLSTIAFVSAGITAVIVGYTAATDFLELTDKIVEFVETFVVKAAQFVSPYLIKVKEQAQKLWGGVKEIATKVFKVACVAASKAVEVGKETIQAISSHFSNVNEGSPYDTEDPEDPICAN